MHRTTVYRRWPNKRSLVLAALLDRTDDQVPIPDTADLRRDLSLLGQAIDSYLSLPQVHALQATMVADRPGSSELSDLRTQLWADRLRQAQAIPRRAIERGDLPADTDPYAPIDMLVGPIHLRRFIQGRPMTAAEIDELAARVVAAFTSRLFPGPVPTGKAGLPTAAKRLRLTDRPERRSPWPGSRTSPALRATSPRTLRRPSTGP